MLFSGIPHSDMVFVRSQISKYLANSAIWLRATNMLEQGIPKKSIKNVAHRHWPRSVRHSSQKSLPEKGGVYSDGTDARKGFFGNSLCYIPPKTKSGSPLIVYGSIYLKMVLWGLHTTLQVPPTRFGTWSAIFWHLKTSSFAKMPTSPQNGGLHVCFLCVCHFWVGLSQI